MSYCRFSSDEFRSDFYVYANVSGKWTLHVAGSRYLHTPPPVYVYPEEHKIVHESGGFGLTPEGSEAWRKWLEECNPLVDIDLPFAGERFDFDTPGECANKLEELAKIGYHLPEGPVERLRSDQEAIDG